MAKRTYQCKKCDTFVKKILDELIEILPCPKCGSDMNLVMTTVSTVVKEVIDNGLQPRKVEQLADAGDLFKEHSAAHEKKKKHKEDL